MAQEKDVVLIHFENQPIGFARIESIQPDQKPEWFQVKLLLLQVPLQSVTWILRPAYINGEPFTMGGKQMRLEKVVCPEEEPAESAALETGPDPDKKKGTAAGKVISLTDLKRK
ncbi:MAG: hypothetical protein PVG78_04285 [Desulfobacterales bacterium]|jgi:hypothetical protein